jgi:hypothetical protein
MDAAVAHALAQKRKQNKRERRGALHHRRVSLARGLTRATEAAAAAGAGAPASGKKQRRGEEGDKRSRKQAAATSRGDPDEEEAEPEEADDGGEYEDDGGAAGGAGDDGDEDAAALRSERFGADGEKVTVQANGILSETRFSTLPLSEATLTVRKRARHPRAAALPAGGCNLNAPRRRCLARWALSA